MRWIWLCSALLMAACGLKASPLPRETIVPAPVRQVTAVVVPEGVRLEFALPRHSLDGNRLMAIGGYRVLRQGMGDKKREIRQEIHLSVSEQRLQPGKKVVFLDSVPAEAGTYRYCVEPFDLYDSSPRECPETEFVWPGKEAATHPTSP